jgi:hypothetical protein
VKTYDTQLSEVAQQFSIQKALSIVLLALLPSFTFDRQIFVSSPLFFSIPVDAKTVTDAVSRDLAQTAQSSSLPTADLRYQPRWLISTVLLGRYTLIGTAEYFTTAATLRSVLLVFWSSGGVL